MTDPNGSPDPKKPKKPTREERLAAQLRENLRRRKAAAKRDKET